MTPEQEKLAWDRHRCGQLREWRDLPFRQKLQILEDMAELAATLKPLPVQQRERSERDAAAVAATART